MLFIVASQNCNAIHQRYCISIVFYTFQECVIWCNREWCRRRRGVNSDCDDLLIFSLSHSQCHKDLSDKTQHFTVVMRYCFIVEWNKMWWKQLRSENKNENVVINWRRGASVFLPPTTASGAIETETVFPNFSSPVWFCPCKFWILNSFKCVILF